MKTIRTNSFWILLLMLLTALTQVSCSSDDDQASTTTMAVYRMDVSNLTANQPLSPPALVLHTPGYQAWKTGTKASEGLEYLAEAGDASLFLSTAMQDADVVATGNFSDIVMPGTSGSIQMELDWAMDLQLSYAAMLVNTNDAFTGNMNLNIGELVIGDSLVLTAVAYDAGTEANTESAATIPGPAGGGEGYNAAKDNPGFVSVHSGVVTVDDGLTGSVLNESHRWQNPVAQIVVTRTH